jgi:hypothetical protein
MFKTFDDTERGLAVSERLETELDFHRRGVKAEVVLLEAASEEALRRTHRRYFEDAREIAKSGTSGTVSKS